MEITPFIPLTLRGRESPLIFDLKRSDFGIWNLANEIAAPRLVGARNDKREMAQNDRKSEGLTKVVLFCH